MERMDDLRRIEQALERAREVASRYTPGEVESSQKAGGSPVTEADLELDRVLKEELLRPDEGWLSEETRDDRTRLERRRVWVVDPLDGTREFVDGIPEWCISVALVEDGHPVAAGICNPPTNELFLGAAECGVVLNGSSVRASERTVLAGGTVLASRSEVKRGQWARFERSPFEIVAMGSVAYKLARVAAGLADATFTLVPKNEWDIAAGVGLILAAGGQVQDRDGNACLFNRPRTLYPGLIASGRHLLAPLLACIRSTAG